VLAGIRAEDHPEVREAVLDGTFQEQSCVCGEDVRIWTPAVYSDFQQGIYVALAGPFHATWREHVAEHAAAFDAAVTLGPPVARRLGAHLRHRLVLDVLALREKILIFEARLDDRVVEALKGDVWRERSLGDDHGVLRVSAVLPGGHLLMGRWRPGAVTGDGPWVMRSPTLLEHVTVTADRYQKRWLRRDAAADHPWLAHAWMVDLHVGAPATG